MTTEYDAIVVGARCAGAPTAMLLARAGCRVLVVDRAHFPSDTVSTHVLHPTAVASLRRWGLLDEVVATGCAPINRYSFDFGPFTIGGTPLPDGGSSTAYAPRRLVLDAILVEAAARAGAEVREGFTVDQVVVEHGRVVGIRGRGADGRTVLERARIVIGADGRHSHVAQAVRPEQYHEKPTLMWGYYTYWSDLPTNGFETFVRPERGFAAAPTNDGLTMVVVGWPYAEADAYKADVERNYLATLELVPEFADRVRGATRQERFTAASSPNFFRKPFGPGWALVGDAGYTKDPVTAQGIPDAFRDAERCVAALREVFDGSRTFDEAMADWQRERDERALPIYEFTTQLATLAPPPPELQQLLGVVAGNQEAMDAFVSVSAGTLSPLAFFDPAHVGRIMEAAGRAA
jgi:flavin-dependent dehydrogenase